MSNIRAHTVFTVCAAVCLFLLLLPAMVGIAIIVAGARFVTALGDTFLAYHKAVANFVKDGSHD